MPRNGFRIRRIIFYCSSETRWGMGSPAGVPELLFLKHVVINSRAEEISSVMRVFRQFRTIPK